MERNHGTNGTRKNVGARRTWKTQELGQCRGTGKLGTGIVGGGVVEQGEFLDLKQLGTCGTRKENLGTLERKFIEPEPRN